MRTRTKRNQTNQKSAKTTKCAPSKPGKDKICKTDKPERPEKHSTTVPDVLYTEDGTIFYPCKNCCRAFARRSDLEKHESFCYDPVVYQQSAPSSTLPLSSVENTMNGIENPVSGSSKSEMNNNGNRQKVEMDTDMETKLTSPQRTREQSKEEKLLKLDVLPNGIYTFDLKTKAKIAKILNGTLENNGFSVVIMGNGDVVTKIHASQDFPQLEFVSRVVMDRETHTERLHLSLRRPASSLLSSPSSTFELPDIPKLLEKLFGPDQIFADLIEENRDVKPQPEEIVMHIDEDSFPTDNEVMSMAGTDGTIVLEDLDIHICKQCGAVYHTLEDLVNHDKYDHRKFKRKYSLEEIEKFGAIFWKSVDNECPICLRQLKNKREWARHAHSHAEVGLFECKVCKKKFTRDDHRKNHEARHVINLDED